MIEVPLKIHNELRNKDNNIIFKAGFVGYDKNDNNEVFPIQGWLTSKFIIK